MQSLVSVHMSPVSISLVEPQGPLCVRPTGSTGCCKSPDYLLEALASLLVGVDLLWGVGILDGLPPCWRDAERGVARLESPTVSDMSEHTDWISEMSKSEASLPLRLLPRLPALLPGRLEVFLDSGKNIEVLLLPISLTDISNCNCRYNFLLRCYWKDIARAGGYTCCTQSGKHWGE